jgi:hypothetical protein
VADANLVAVNSASWAVDSQAYGSPYSQLSSRPAYRPTTFAAISSDQALLAWLAETGANEGAEMDGTAIDQQPTSDTGSVDDAFESLEAVMLGADGVV